MELSLKGIKSVTLLVAAIMALFSWEAGAQVFRGEVLDAASMGPIPYAHVQLVMSPGQGTITNARGRFGIPREPGWPDDVKVRISFLGYQSIETDISIFQSATILLKKDAQKLPTVSISPGDYERDLLRRVIRKIPENFPNGNERLLGVVTEKGFADTLNARPLYTATATTAADKRGYQKRRDYGNVAVLEGRVDTFPDYKQSDFRISAGVFNIHRFDVIQLRIGPFQESKLKDYDFERMDLQSFDGQPIQPIRFSGENMSGIVYINMIDTAVHEIEVQAKPGAFHTFGSILECASCRTYLNFKTGYAKYDGLYRLKFIHYHTAFYVDKKKGERFFLENTYAITEFGPAVAPIKEIERVGFNDRLTDLFPLNVPLRDSDSLTAQSEGPLIPHKISPANQRRDNWLNRISSDIGYFRMHYEHGMIPYGNSEADWPEELTGELGSSSSRRQGLAFQANYRLNARFSVILNSAGVFSNAYSLQALGMEAAKSIGFAGKWSVKIAATAGLESYSKHIANIGNASDFEMLSPYIDFENTSMNHLTQRVVFAPIFTVSYIFRKNLRFALSALYIVPFRTDTYLMFRNKDFSWPWQRSTYTVEQPGGNAYGNNFQLQLRVGFGSL